MQSGNTFANKRRPGLHPGYPLKAQTQAKDGENPKNLHIYGAKPVKIIRYCAF
jgi:hypothetical protein